MRLDYKLAHFSSTSLNYRGYQTITSLGTKWCYETEEAGVSWLACELQ